MQEPVGWDVRWASAEKVISYSVGIGLVLYESIVRHGQDPAVIGMIGFLLGFPTVRQGERRRQQRRRAR